MSIQVDIKERFIRINKAKVSASKPINECEYLYFYVSFVCVFCRTHRHQKEETVAERGRVQKEKSSSTLPTFWWIWCLFLTLSLS